MKGTTIMKADNLTALQSDALRSQLRQACAEHTKASIMLAKGLFEVYYGSVLDKGTSRPLHEAWGYESFGEYAEHELSIHAGTARRYVEVYDELVIKRSFLDPKTGASYGKTVLPDSIGKLRTIAGISRVVKTERELLSWISRSLELSACDFEEEVDKAFHLGSSKKHSISFSLPSSRLKVMMKALDAAKERFSVGSRAEALTAIVEAWAADQTEPRVAPKVGKAKRKHRHSHSHATDNNTPAMQ